MPRVGACQRSIADSYLYLRDRIDRAGAAKAVGDIQAAAGALTNFATGGHQPVKWGTTHPFRAAQLA